MMDYACGLDLNFEVPCHIIGIFLNKFDPIFVEFPNLNDSERQS